MQRYFIKTPIKALHTIEDSEIIHHVSRVLRSEVGDVFVLCDLNSQCFEVKIQTITDKKITVERQYEIKPQRHPINITLAQALIRKERFETVLQKATELGVETFIPLKCRRSVVKLTQENTDKKLKRFAKIAQEAAEQSRREHLMSVMAPRTIDTLDFSAYDHVIVAYEGELSTQTKHVLKSFNHGQNILILIGPEGGFSPEEITSLKDKGAKSISLGPRILRSETAAIYVLSAISYEIEMSE